MKGQARGGRGDRPVAVATEDWNLTRRDQGRFRSRFRSRSSRSRSCSLTGCLSHRKQQIMLQTMRELPLIACAVNFARDRRFVMWRGWREAPGADCREHCEVDEHSAHHFGGGGRGAMERPHS